MYRYLFIAILFIGRNVLASYDVYLMDNTPSPITISSACGMDINSSCNTRGNGILNAYQRKLVASVSQKIKPGHLYQVRNNISDQKHNIEGYFLTEIEGSDGGSYIVSVNAVINGKYYTLLDGNNEKGKVLPGVIGKHEFKTPDNETFNLYAVAEKDHHTLQGIDSLYLALDKNPVILHSSKENELTIDTYNIKTFPNYIGIAVDLNKMNSRVRYMIKSDSLKHADILVFEEAWDKKSRNTLIEGFKKEYPYSYSPIPRHSYLKPLYSGLLILSKYPVIKSYFINYQDYQRLVGFDNFSNKGAAFVKIEKDGRFYNIIATHVQSGDKKAIAVRNEEFSLIKEHIIDNEDLNISRDTPLILVGDLNTNFYTKSDFTIIKDTLSLDDKWIGNGINENPKYSNDSELNLMISPKTTSKALLDYITPIVNYPAPSKVTEQVTVIRALDDARMYEPSKNTFLYHYGDIDLSDHFMLQAKFVF